MMIQKFVHTFNRNVTQKFGNRNALMIVAGLAILLAAIYYIYVGLFLGGGGRRRGGGKEGMDDAGKKQAELMLFYADWCPACKATKPEWFALKESMDGSTKTINGYHVIFTEVDCTKTTDETQRKMQKFGVKGFPSIYLLKDGQKLTLGNARPTKAELQAFLEENL